MIISGHHNTQSSHHLRTVEPQLIYSARPGRHDAPVQKVIRLALRVALGPLGLFEPFQRLLTTRLGERGAAHLVGGYGNQRQSKAIKGNSRMDGWSSEAITLDPRPLTKRTCTE